MRPIGCQLGTAGLPRGMHSLVSMERAQFAGAGRLPQTSLRTQWHSARLSRPCSNETVAREASATARQAPQPEVVAGDAARSAATRRTNASGTGGGSAESFRTASSRAAPEPALQSVKPLAPGQAHTGAAGAAASEAVIDNKAATSERPTAAEALEAATDKAAGTHGASTATAAPRSTMVTRAMRSLVNLPVVLASKTFEIVRLLFTDPPELMRRLRTLKAHTKEVLEHYWMGTKLLWSDTSTAIRLMKRVLNGNGLSRRERKQLLRTATDLFRLVPFAIFVIVPFMEFLLPVALKLFPNMLPSTFQSSLARQENMRKMLKLRLELASFMQDTVAEMAKKVKKRPDADSDTAKELLQHLERARRGEPLPNEMVLKLAKLFRDDITLDNISRPLLATMCKFMDLPPYGNESVLRFQLRNKLRRIKNDDQLILWEGMDSLTLDELKQACQERGMRATGLSEEGYRRQLAQWLELSVMRDVPISLLVLSRSFSIISREESVENTLSAGISAMDDEVVNEAVLEHAGHDDPEIRRLRLESLRYQNELIADEQQERDAAKQEKRLQEEAVQKARAEEAKALAEAEAAGTAAESAAAAVVQAGTDAVVEDKETEAAVDAAAASMRLDVEQPAADATPAASSTPSAAPAAASPAAAPAPAAVTSPAPAPAPASITRPAPEVMLSAASTAAKEMAATGEVERPSVAQAGADREDLLDRADRILRTLKLAEMAECNIELTAEQADALASLASVSPLVREREQLLRLRKLVEAEERLAMIEKKGEEAAQDRSTEMVQHKVAKMLATLERDLQRADTAMGDMWLLDKDMDGVLSAEEVHMAVKTLLTEYNTDEEAAAVVRALDKDGDGKVTLRDIMRAAVRKDTEY